MTIDPQGLVLELSPTDKVPGIYLNTVFGIGRASSSSIPKYLMLVGIISSAGTMDTNVVYDVFTEEEAATLAGPGSQLHLMVRAALRIDGIRVKMIGLPIAGLTAATATITIDGTFTTAGEWRFRIGGVYLFGGILAGDTKSAIATAIAAAITANKDLPVSAAAAAGAGTDYIVTLTTKSPGLWGNTLIVWTDTQMLPSGMTVVLGSTGGAATGNGGRTFGSGATSPSVTDAITAMTTSGRFYRMAGGQNDSTALGLWRDYFDYKAGPLVGMPEHGVFATPGTLSAATALAQGLNEQRAMMLWMEEAETPFPAIAATMAAVRLQAEQVNPNRSYDDLVLPGVKYQTDPGTAPTRSELVAALDVGLTPIKSANNNAMVVRAITTRSLNDAGGIDDGTLDVADAAVPDAVRDEIALFWETAFRPNNPYLDDDPAEGAQPPVAGTAYPALWAAEVKNLLKDLARQQWITKVDTNPPRAVLNTAASTPRIACFVPVVVLPKQHQLEGTIAQIRYNAAA